MYLLARGNDAANRWLAEHPMVLGGIFLFLGGLVLAFGINALVTGKSRSKWGIELTGPMAYLHGTVMAVAGTGMGLFGLYKFVSAFF